MRGYMPPAPRFFHHYIAVNRIQETPKSLEHGNGPTNWIIGVYVPPVVRMPPIYRCNICLHLYCTIPKNIIFGGKRFDLT